MPSETASPALVATLKKWRRKRGNLIMVLHDIQDHYGHVPRNTALTVAKELDVPMAQIHEVLTFYNYFKLSPPGKHVVSTCMGTACYLRGAPTVMQSLSDRLRIGDGQTSADGEFHLQSVRCLGCCGLAPVVMINGRIHSKVRANDVPNMIEDCLADTKGAPHGQADSTHAA